MRPVGWAHVPSVHQAEAGADSRPSLKTPPKCYPSEHEVGLLSRGTQRAVPLRHRAGRLRQVEIRGWALAFVSADPAYSTCSAT